MIDNMMANHPVLLLTLSIIIFGFASTAGLSVLVLNSYSANDWNMSFETGRLFFAVAVLLGIGLIFFEAMIIDYYSTDTNTQIFDTCKTVLPPIATLVLGFFFGVSVQ